MKTFTFHKMHGLGNDFVIIDAMHQAIVLDNFSIPLLADRRCGIGFDQLLLLEPSTVADLRCRIFNADGSEAEQCGNGMRCVARFVHEEKIISRTNLSIETTAGLVQVEISDYDNIRTNMGVPQIQSESITLPREFSEWMLTTLSLGNPHAIARVESLKEFPVAEWGTKIASHSSFPNGVNVGFMEIIDRKLIHLRTHERGVGETLACGSNACAAVIAGMMNGWLDAHVSVRVACGEMAVEWKGKDSPIYLTGPTARVYSGSLTS